MTSDNNKDLPALPEMGDNLLPEGFDDGHGAGADLTPYLSIDHEKAVWVSNEVEFGEILMSVWASHYYRACHNAAYNSDDKRVACASWDGVHAFGNGGRVPKGERPDFRERTCAERVNGRLKPICPAAYGDEWVCRPSLRLFGMFGDPDGGNWVPFFWRASGRNVKPVEQLLTKLRMKRATKALKPYQVYVSATLERKGNGAIVHFGSPFELDLNDPGASGVVEFAAEAADVFREECEKERQSALDLPRRWEEASQG